MPIGNLTSQFFANVYLSGFDHFVKERLHMEKYVRYVDDFALFDDDHSRLAEAKKLIEQHLAGLRVRIHPIKSQLFETRQGANFVGFRVLPDRIRVRAENLKRARRRWEKWQERFRLEPIKLFDLTQSMRSWIAHLEHGDTWRLRERIFSQLVFARS